MYSIFLLQGFHGCQHGPNKTYTQLFVPYCGKSQSQIETIHGRVGFLFIDSLASLTSSVKL